ncbi:MAG TPA: hypothetical protein PK014_01990 [Thermoanaerobaculia bacterium]|nr:hypothetical protein [Thermoanaerobaculia bacterium]HUM28536.1 hypothetical protein [Thermoanaerobaculia bacterium]HXK66856.1 hypothetical protein [Thermoanaerobaculia bacterium]
MKCRMCGQEFPSVHYFQTSRTCTSCYRSLSPGEQKKVQKEDAPDLSHADARPVSIDGKDLVCPFCGNDTFWARQTLMNTRGLTFAGLEWANREADNYICNRCGYVYWFFRVQP